MRKATQRIVRNIGNKILRPFRLSIRQRWVAQNEIVSIEGMSQGEASKRFEWLQRKLSFRPERIVDIGASDGRWTKPMISIFPTAHFLLVEPLTEHSNALEQLSKTHPNLQYIKKIVASTHCQMKIHCHAHQSSVFGDCAGNTFGDVLEMEAIPLDSLLESCGFGFPDVIKLDIQGAELDALKGAPLALSQAQFVQLEFSLIPFQKDIPLFDEIVVFMSEAGFRVFDIYGVCGRPLDGMPAQGECLFIRKDNQLITNYRWSEHSVWS